MHWINVVKLVRGVGNELAIRTNCPDVKNQPIEQQTKYYLKS